MINDLDKARLLLKIDGKIHGIMEDLKAICDDSAKWHEGYKMRFYYLFYGFRRELDFMRDFDLQMQAAMVCQMRMHMIIWLKSDSKVEREEAGREILHYLRKELKITEYAYEGYLFNENTLQVTR